MRKRVISMAAFLAVALLAAGCGKKEIKVADYNVDDYVKLGDYKNIVVEYTKSFAVTDEEVEEQIKSILQTNTTFENITNRDTAKEGDYVNIDYQGKIGGQAFQGGTATGADIQIGSGTFIPGFEDQLVGAKVGTTFDINVKFPENYKTTDLAGKDAVFTITLNAIRKKVTPELTDEYVQKVSTQSKTVKEYKAEIKKSMQQSRDSEVEEYRKYYAESKAIENAEVTSYPEGLIEKMVADYKETIEKVAKEAGKSFDDYVKETFSLESKELDEKLTEYMKQTAKINLVLEAIEKKENITMSDEEMEKAILDYAKSQNCETKEDLYKKFKEEEVKRYVKQVKVLDFICESATIVEKQK
ncbi:MAG: trigger factor [Lachnospiraceae bacterium]|jgi:trigger factor|nr:trigger factor [Lachnospiraceae bacterium]